MNLNLFFSKLRITEVRVCLSSSLSIETDNPLPSSLAVSKADVFTVFEL
jgi:hypothetical protein